MALLLYRIGSDHGIRADDLIDGVMKIRMTENLSQLQADWPLLTDVLRFTLQSRISRIFSYYLYCIFVLFME